MNPDQWISLCTDRLNYLLPSRLMVAYKLKFREDGKMWTFEMYLEDGTFYMYNMPEHVMGPDEYERFKKRLGELFP